MMVSAIGKRPWRLMLMAFLLLGLIWLATLPVGRAAAQSSFCDPVSQIPTSECQALESFFNATGGIAWTDKSGWLSSTTPCDDWYGLSCSGDQVFQINLSANNLSGSLPASIAGLTAIQILQLDNNSLSGPLPVEIGQMTSLRRLNLASNELDGALPTGLGNLVDLQELSLGFNHFSGAIPTSLSALSDLTILELVANQFDSAIPAELGDLPRLEWLDLGANQLTGEIPAELAGPTDLQTLYLEGNLLQGEVPTELCNANKLVFATLGFNRLETQAADPCIKQKVDIEWDETQTLPPEGVLASTGGPGEVQLSWTPVSYTADGGYYEIYSAEASGGPYVKQGQTSDKSIANFKVTNLTPSKVYFFVVRTVTPAHQRNPNELVSRDSNEISSAPVAITLADFEVRQANSQPFLLLAALMLLLSGLFVGSRVWARQERR